MKKVYTPKIVLVGNPNVGKSVIFNNLTGAYVTVSNYPGTTVDVSRGKTRIADIEYEVIDTPGMYSLMPISEEEAVARKLLFEESPDILIHVVDTKNIQRMLPLTLSLIEAELPVVLVLNIMDEAEGMGMVIDADMLSGALGVPVVMASAALGKGMDALKKTIKEYVSYAA